MSVQLNLFAVILLFAFIQGIIYSILFIRRGIKEGYKSDFWIAALIISLCVFNLSWILGFMGIYILGQELWFFPTNANLIIGPVIYYYLKTQINSDFEFSRKDFRHFIPYTVYFIYHFVIFSSGKHVVDRWSSVFHNRFHIGYIEELAESISVCIYLMLSIRLYRKYLKWLPNERSDSDLMRFNWYRNFLIAIIVGVCSAILFTILSFRIELSFREVWIQRTIVAGLIYYISISAYAQPQPHRLIFDEHLADKNQVEENFEIKSEEISASEFIGKDKPLEKKMDTLEIEKWKTKIEDTMLHEKLFLNAELTLSDLSEKIETHNSLTSNIINSVFNKNFNDFVNEFRVKIFLEKINNPKLQHLTLSAIAFDCGFNSKSTFNRAVKKVTGKSPSDFIFKKD